jgi:hypothetical protein
MPEHFHRRRCDVRERRPIRSDGCRRRTPPFNPAANFARRSAASSHVARDHAASSLNSASNSRYRNITHTFERCRARPDTPRPLRRLATSHPRNRAGERDDVAVRWIEDLGRRSALLFQRPANSGTLARPSSQILHRHPPVVETGAVSCTRNSLAAAIIPPDAEARGIRNPRSA